VADNIGVRARGLRGLQPPRLGQNHYFSKAKLFRQKPTAKNEEKYFLHLLNEKTELILSSEIKCPKSGIFTNNYWVG